MPAIAHYVWLGGPLPKFMRQNIDRFRTLHPEWEIKLWHGIPDNLPDDLRRACLRLPQLCMRSDIIRVWVLHESGGIYLDGDVFPVRAFDELRHFEHFYGSEREGKAGTNCVVGTTPESTFIKNLLLRIRSIVSSPGEHLARSALGPRLLTEFIHSYPGLVNPLPDHFFCLFQDHEFAFSLTTRSFPEIHRELVRNEHKFTDRVWPYGIHTYGMPSDQVAFAKTQSSHVGVCHRADALMNRLPKGHVVGVEVGVADGRMSAYLFGHLPGLHLTLVDRWAPPPAGSTYTASIDHIAGYSVEAFEAARKSMLTATEFASGRRRVLQMESIQAAVCLDDASLDFVFIDADHSFEAVQADLSVWHPKIRPGGWLCGHDYHGLEGVNWGVSRAVDEFAGLQGLRVERDKNDTWFIQLPAS